MNIRGENTSNPQRPLKVRVHKLPTEVEGLAAGARRGQGPGQGGFAGHALGQARQFEAGVVREHLHPAVGELEREAVAGREQGAGVGLAARAARLLDADLLADRAAQGCTVRYGDFDKPETLEQAVQGAERMLLISGTRVGARVVRADKEGRALSRNT